MSSIYKIDSSKFSIFAFGFFSGEEQAIINIDKMAKNKFFMCKGLIHVKV